MMGCLNQQSEVNTRFSEPKDCTLKPFKGDLACMVNSEIGAVLAVMRRNVRWGFRYAADDDHLEHPLIHSFKELRKSIFSWQHHWNKVDPLLYLRPFLDVIQSDETGAPITGVALSSVYKFLTLEIIDSAIMNVEKSLHQIVETVTSCRFEVTDPASEEVVLMKILQVLLACMKSKASANLSNHHVCNIVNTCFRLVHQASAKSELLQRIARHTMHELVRHIFSHLPNIDSKAHEFDQQSRLCVDPEMQDQLQKLMEGMISIKELGELRESLTKLGDVNRDKEGGRAESSTAQACSMDLPNDLRPKENMNHGTFFTQFL
ncbi:putative vesicle transport v-SNARE 12-like [Capsicum annuum]|nr:putative vesicle transport v-SNARE 12-like [Capsicum annuum]